MLTSSMEMQKVRLEEFCAFSTLPSNRCQLKGGVIKLEDAQYLNELKPLMNIGF